jgi:hypothetical protein
MKTIKEMTEMKSLIEKESLTKTSESFLRKFYGSSYDHKNPWKYKKEILFLIDQDIKKEDLKDRFANFINEYDSNFEIASMFMKLVENPDSKSDTLQILSRFIKSSNATQKDFVVITEMYLNDIGIAEQNISTAIFCLESAKEHSDEYNVKEIDKAIDILAGL